MVYIIKREYIFQVNEYKYNLKSGNTIFLPRNIQHAFIQLTEKVKVIDSFLPLGRMESFFELFDSWTLSPTKEQIAKAFIDHDMKIVGQPLKIK